MKLIARIKKEIVLIDSKFYSRNEWPSGLITWTKFEEEEAIEKEEELIKLTNAYKASQTRLPSKEK